MNGSNSVDADSDVAAAVKTDGTAGTAGGMVIASRGADTAAGAASDGTGADPATDANRTTRSHDGQVILAQAAQADKNVNAHITLPAGEGMGPQAETYDWIMDPDTVDVDGTAVAVPVQAGDVGQVQAPRQAISGFMWMDGDNAGNGNDGLYDDGTVSGTAEAPVEGLAVALERYVITAERPDRGPEEGPAEPHRPDRRRRHLQLRRPAEPEVHAGRRARGDRDHRGRGRPGRDGDPHRA